MPCLQEQELELQQQRGVRNGFCQGIIVNMEINNLYAQIYNIGNLFLAWQKARKGKTRKEYVIEFEKDLF